MSTEGKKKRILGIDFVLFHLAEPEDETRPIRDENWLETTDRRSTLTRMTGARRKSA
jgi:hypothetical protein